MSDNKPNPVPEKKPETGRGDTLNMNEAWAHMNLPKPELKPSKTGFGKPRRRR